VKEPTLHVGSALDGRLWTLRFDHGRANEIGSAQIEELDGLAGAIEADRRAIALISMSRRVSRKGTPIFVAGADVTERAGWDDERVKAHVARQRAVLHRIRRLPVLHVAVVSGLALGWGTEWLLTADWRIATPGAVFALPETGLGILPGAGGTADLWAHVGVAHALRLGITGARLDHEEACRIGLVQELAPDLDAGLARAEAMAAEASRRSPTAMAAYKRAVLDAVGLPPAQRQAVEAAAYAHTVDSGEAAIGRACFAELTAGGTAPWGPRT
jgi:enoyl-CoA hydratase/carnithine racemase